MLCLHTYCIRRVTTTHLSSDSHGALTWYSWFRRGTIGRLLRCYLLKLLLLSTSLGVIIGNLHTLALQVSFPLLYHVWT